MNPKNDAVGAEAARFRSTHWSVVLTAAQDETPAGRAALAELYQSYWYPLYAHVRRRGYSPQDSQDLTQGFFLHLLEHHGLAQVDPHKGRFRSFLLTSLQNFLSTEQRRERTIKRGGLCTFISLEAQAVESRYQLEPVDDSALTAEQMFDARWALTLLDKAMAGVQAQYVARGKGKIFETLKGFLPGGSTEELRCYHEAAEALGVSEASVSTLIHRLRQQYSVALRCEVARTVSEPAAIDGEIHLLCEALVAAEGHLAE
ncbi:MAG: sigma-70 family RNA polymerase sigma factor [Chthoniobacterales bacterium]